MKLHRRIDWTCGGAFCKTVQLTDPQKINPAKTNSNSSNLTIFFQISDLNQSRERPVRWPSWPPGPEETGGEEDSRSESPLLLVTRAQVLMSQSLPARPGNVLGAYWSGHKMQSFISQWIPSQTVVTHQGEANPWQKSQISFLCHPCHASFLLTGYLPREETLLTSNAYVFFLTRNPAPCRQWLAHGPSVTPQMHHLLVWPEEMVASLSGNIVAMALQYSAPLHPHQLSSCGVW